MIEPEGITTSVSEVLHPFKFLLNSRSKFPVIKAEVVPEAPFV